jgi:GGDEF domain-containing protein
MSSLKKSIFWVTVYLSAIVILAQFDYFDDTIIIDFAKYFYITGLLVVPVTVFIPSISKVNVFVPMFVWGCIYLVVMQSFDRAASSVDDSFIVAILEFIMIEAGAWLGYQLALGINHAESVMDAMALAAFPNRTQSLQDASRKIKTEFTRSRRYHRPLGLLVLQFHLDEHVRINELVASIQNDLSSRFSFARIGQVIDEHIRQTDMVFRERGNRFVILCPETTRENVEVLARRIVEAVEHRTKMQVDCGVADFPNDALNFDDLLDLAISRLARQDKSAELMHTHENVEVH